jgi:Protein of unknown function (DUF2442)
MKIEKLWFENDYVFIKTDVGHIVGNPLSWFPVLQNATIEQRNNFEIGHYGIYWPDLNEDLGLSGFFQYKTDSVLV